MSESPTTDPDPLIDAPVRRGPRPLFLAGCVLWGVCFVSLGLLWFQWSQKALARKGELAARTAQAGDVADDDDGRPRTQIKLVPQQDGTLVPKEIVKGEDDSPWEAEGIADFSFTDTDGKTVTKKDLLGKPFIIAFVFTHCRGPCPKVTLQMREIQDRLKDYDFNLVTLTVDPERDTTEMLKQYGKDQGADFDRWKFLTGDQAEIYGLIQNSFKMPVEEAKGEKRVPGFEIIHSTNIMLVDATGRVIGKYNAWKDEDAEMARLRKDLKRLAKSKTNEQPVEGGGGQK